MGGDQEIGIGNPIHDCYFPAPADRIPLLIFPGTSGGGAGNAGMLILTWYRIPSWFLGGNDAKQSRFFLRVRPSQFNMLLQAELPSFRRFHTSVTSQAASYIPEQSSKFAGVRFRHNTVHVISTQFASARTVVKTEVVEAI